MGNFKEILGKYMVNTKKYRGIKRGSPGDIQGETTRNERKHMEPRENQRGKQNVIAKGKLSKYKGNRGEI